MFELDWRKLYAHNQAAIAAAGVRPPAMPRAEPPAALGKRLSPSALSPPIDDRILVHVPPHLDPSVPVAAVCMLHGCAQDPASFAAATAMNDAADRHGFVVVYPAQSRARNQLGCWNWFLPAHQQRGAGEPELIAGIARGLIGEEFGQAVDPARIFVAGLSSGAAMAVVLAACYPDLFAAVAIHSGLPYRSASDTASAFAVMRQAQASRARDGHPINAAMGEHARVVPSLVVHGTADRTVAPENAQRILAQSMHANHLAAPERCRHQLARPTNCEPGRADGGLGYTRKRWVDTHGALTHESIEVHGLGHAWSGGIAGGSYTDPRGPSATEAIWAFFSQAGRTA